LAFAFLVLVTVGFATGAEAAPRSVYLEDLTWTELRDALKAGVTTVIIPAGGTEQSGPHMALGKHNARVKALAGRIATELGDTVVAPVIAYVPEGDISPPTEHMRFPGTLSVPDSVFKGTVEAAARSLRQAGFTHIVLIGDHGGYQPLLKAAAADLNRDWAGTRVRAHFIDDYYRGAQTAYVQALRAKGLSNAEIGSHAGTADTSLQMAVDPAMVRTDRLEGNSPGNGPANGTVGDPRPSTAALGQLGVDLIVAQTVAAIKKARTEKR
jgi:creatinine amidohydrolase/Fe(II)-dependent formamide hydrolase-like protein